MSRVDDQIDKLEELKEQQAGWLKDYGKQVKDFSAQIDALKGKKDLLLNDIENLSSEKDKIKNEMVKIKTKNDQIIQDQLNAAKEKLAIAAQAEQDALSDHQNLINEYKVKIEIVKKQNDEYEVKIADVNKRLKEVEQREADVKKIDSALISEKDRYEKLSKVIVVEREAVKNKQSDLEHLDETMQKNAAKNLEIAKKYHVLMLEVEDEKSKQLKLTEEQSRLLSELKAKKDVELVEIEDMRQTLIKQSENNKFRSQELDVGFEKFARDGEYLKKEFFRLDNLKQEINKLRGVK